jgi:hypothetical protein
MLHVSGFLKWGAVNVNAMDRIILGTMEDMILTLPCLYFTQALFRQSKYKAPRSTAKKAKFVNAVCPGTITLMNNKNQNKTDKIHKP